jgi:uncharacterized membrane protein YkoI
MKPIRIMLLGIALAGIAGGTIAATRPLPLKGNELARSARINLATARMAALRVRPGIITEQELEREAGGSGLRYTFIIQSRHKPYEVGVDAANGVVLENIPESKNPD